MKQDAPPLPHHPLSSFHPRRCKSPSCTEPTFPVDPIPSTPSTSFGAMLPPFFLFSYTYVWFFEIKKKSKIFILTVLFLFGLIILFACINLGKAITSQITSASSSMCVSHSVVSNFSDPKDSSLPGSSVHGIFQARILKWVSIPFSRGSS